jgi:hypothetical protein
VEGVGIKSDGTKEEWEGKAIEINLGRWMFEGRED